MPQVFLSHSSKDKRIVHPVMDALKKSLINAWIYDREIAAGGGLLVAITEGLSKSQYCLAFLSQNYLTSSWCMDELQWAFSLHQKNKLCLIPVLLEERNQLGIEALPPDKQSFIELLLSQLKYISFDPFDVEKSIGTLLKEFWANEPVRFDPIKTGTIDGVQVQVLRYALKNDLPENFLQTWTINIEDFISANPNDGKPIQPNLPVAFNGVSINWLITYLVIPFKNRQTVYVYNRSAQGYVCVFALKGDTSLGRVLKGN